MIQLRPVWCGATAERALGKTANEHSSRRIETRIDAASTISWLFARTWGRRKSARHTISPPKSAQDRENSCIDDDATWLSTFDFAWASSEQLPAASPSTRPQLYETCSKSRGRVERTPEYPPRRRKPLIVGKYRRTDCSLVSLDWETQVRRQTTCFTRSRGCIPEFIGFSARVHAS